MALCVTIKAIPFSKMQLTFDFAKILYIQPAWVLQDEAMGSKQKFWFRRPDHRENWLFKYPQSNTGQHWAEKIAAEIANELGILHARVTLAEFEGIAGSASQSFTRKGRELFHGNQILEGYISGYDRSRRFRQSNHTLANILGSLDSVFSQVEVRESAKRQIAAYLILDALIGNTDRHHENWGVLIKQTSIGSTGIVAPSFDHASSLGRELQDGGTGKCRVRILRENRIGQYSEGAPGAIYWNPEDRKAVGPLELVRRASREHPGLFRPALGLLGRINRVGFSNLVSKIPTNWMSGAAREFAIELLCYNLSQLTAIRS